MKKILKNLCIVSVLSTTTIGTMVPCYGSDLAETVLISKLANILNDLEKQDYMRPIKKNNEGRFNYKETVSLYKKIPDLLIKQEHDRLVKNISESIGSIKYISTLYSATATIILMYTTIISLMFEDYLETSNILKHRYIDYINYAPVPYCKEYFKDRFKPLWENK